MLRGPVADLEPIFARARRTLDNPYSVLNEIAIGGVKSLPLVAMHYSFRVASILLTYTAVIENHQT